MASKTDPVAPREPSYPTEAEQKWAEHGAVIVTTPQVEASLDGASRSESQTVKQALGRDGFLSSSSATSWLGPQGDNPWNVSYWTQAGWSRRAREASRKSGPTSEAGPLANQQTFRAWTCGQLYAPGGKLGVAGSEGVMSARGVFGAAGTVGAHGFARDENGQYVREDGSVVRSIEVKKPDGTVTEVDLAEHYEAEFAQSFPDNDTSWMTRAVAKRVTEDAATANLGSTVHMKSIAADGDKIPFTVPTDQWVTVAVVPERRQDSFRLTLTDRQGRFVAGSDSRSLGNAIQVQLPAGMELCATVEYVGTDGVSSSLTSALVQATVSPVVAFFGALYGARELPEPGAYRLFCTPSARDSAAVERHEGHQARVCWLDPSRGR